MIDFLARTYEKRDDVVREKFIREYFLPFMPPMKKRLAELKTPYLNLFDALEKMLNYELQTIINKPKQLQNKI
jgi:nitrate reductase assembly molybdenum cofactor insertion protein NarJ